MSLKYAGDYYKNPDIIIIKYLNEQKKSIFKKIKEHDRLLLVAPTGSGKTSLFRNNTDDLLKIYDRIIFVFPLLSIQKQLDDEWNTDLSLNFRITKPSAVEESESAERISSTYRSLHKISHLIGENDLVILDEIHTLFNDNLPSLNEDNKDRIIKAIEDIFISKANIVAMSATPQTFISKALGFSSLVINYSKVFFKRKINIVYTLFYPSYLLLQIGNVLDGLSGEEKLVIYYKNKNKLLLFKYYFNDSNDNSIITGDFLRENEDDFDSHLDQIFNDNRIIYTTNAISTGVSINNPNVKKLIIFDVYESDEIVQVSSRFRKVFDLDIIVLLDEDDRDNSRLVFNKSEISDINYHFKKFRNKKFSFFNHGILESLKSAQLKLVKDRYKGISSKNLGSELVKYTGFDVAIDRNKQTNIDIDFSETRSDFFVSSKNDLNLRTRVAIDTIDIFNLDSSLRNLLRIVFQIPDQIEYKNVLVAFSDPNFLKPSAKYFNLSFLIDNNLLLTNWNYLNKNNIRNIEVGVISKYVYKLVILDKDINAYFPKWAIHNAEIVQKAFNLAIDKSKFNQGSLQGDYFQNKYFLELDDKSKKPLIQKDIVSIVRSMFKISTKGKGKKVEGHYFHYFELPTFDNASPTSDDNLVYSKEGDRDVLYVYDWDRTRDNLVLQKKLSKVLVSDEDLIRNIINK